MARILTPEALKKRRKALGMSRAELAERLGVNAFTVARWEWGPTKAGGMAMSVPIAIEAFLEKLEAKKKRDVDADSC